MVDRALADWTHTRGAAALALDSSLFHQTPASPHLPCATIAWWEAKLQPRSSPQPLLRDVCLPTRPLKDLDFYTIAETTSGAGAE
jgi:hypothetical protein